MSSTIQWCDGPRPRVKRPSHTAWFDNTCCAIATGWRVWIGITAVPSSTRLVALPISATAVSASKSFGTWGTQIDAKPSRSAACAAAMRRVTLSGRWPFSAPIIRPIRMTANVILIFRERASRNRREQPEREVPMSRVAVVTGAASGMGLAIAQRLAAAGNSVALLDLDGEAAAKAAADLGNDGHPTIGVAVDVSDRAQVDAALERTRSELGPVAIMVTSAGFDRFESFIDIAVEDWQRMLDVNLTGTFHCLQAAVPDML